MLFSLYFPLKHNLIKNGSLYYDINRKKEKEQFL